MNGVQAIKRSWTEEYIPKTKHTQPSNKIRIKRRKGRGTPKEDGFMDESEYYKESVAIPHF